jgi:hypothetical protein
MEDRQTVYKKKVWYSNRFFFLTVKPQGRYGNEQQCHMTTESNCSPSSNQMRHTNLVLGFKRFYARRHFFEIFKEGFCLPFFEI